jgi:hypothetical protein
MSSGDDRTSERNRVYRAQLSLAPAASPWRFSVGRQLCPDLAAVSVFDGLLVRREGASWQWGLFAGTQPDPSDYGFSTTTREFGGFGRLEHRGADRRRLMLTSGLIGSYEEGELNREYLFLRGRLQSRRLHVNATQEVDINRGWKADAGERGLELTSTYASLHFVLAAPLTLQGGFDNRRQIRLYRDRVTPETDFDDSYRQGTWIGATQKLGCHARLSLRGRSRSGGIRALTLTATAEITSLGRLRLRTRNTRFENALSDGWFHAVTAGLPIGRAVRCEVTRGMRREKEGDGRTETHHWTTLDLSLSLYRRWYLWASGEENHGDGENSRAIYSGLRYRF